MTPEQERMLRESLELSRDTHEMVKKLHRDLVINRVIKVVYWVVIIGVAVGAFYFLQPYVETLQDVYGGLADSKEQFKALMSF